MSWLAAALRTYLAVVVITIVAYVAYVESGMENAVDAAVFAAFHSVN